MAFSLTEEDNYTTISQGTSACINKELIERRIDNNMTQHQNPTFCYQTLRDIQDIIKTSPNILY